MLSLSQVLVVEVITSKQSVPSYSTELSYIVNKILSGNSFTFLHLFIQLLYCICPQKKPAYSLILHEMLIISLY